MTDSIDTRLMALLEGQLDEPARLALLDEISADPDLLAQLERASAGLVRVGEAWSVRGTVAGRSDPPARTHGVPPWWLAAAAAITLLVSVPVTAGLTASGAARSAPPPTPDVATFAASPPPAPAPSYMLVLQGVWPDRETLRPDQVSARADEYWAYVSRLAEEGLLVAAGDVRFEGGRRVGVGDASPLSLAEIRSPEHVVGIVTVRVPTYEAAVAIAAQSPHLRYGGTIAVREVGLGFVAVPGMDDWAG